MLIDTTRTESIGRFNLSERGAVFNPRCIACYLGTRMRSCSGVNLASMLCRALRD